MLRLWPHCKPVVATPASPPPSRLPREPSTRRAKVIHKPAHHIAQPSWNETLQFLRPVSFPFCELHPTNFSLCFISFFSLCPPSFSGSFPPLFVMELFSFCEIFQHCHLVHSTIQHAAKKRVNFRCECTYMLLYYKTYLGNISGKGTLFFFVLLPVYASRKWKVNLLRFTVKVLLQNKVCSICFRCYTLLLRDLELGLEKNFHIIRMLQRHTS